MLSNFEKVLGKLFILYYILHPLNLIARGYLWAISICIHQWQFFKENPPDHKIQHILIPYLYISYILNLFGHIIFQKVHQNISHLLIKNINISLYTLKIRFKYPNIITLLPLV